MAIYGGPNSHIKDNTGIPNPFYGKTTATATLQKQRPADDDTSFTRRADSDVERVCSRKSTIKPRVSFEYVSSEKDRWYSKTSFEPQSSELLHQTKKVPPDKYAQSASFSAERGFHDENRPPPGLFSYCGFRIAPPISQVSFQQHNLPNDVLTFRSGQRTKSVCNLVKLGGPGIKKPRHKGHSVLGRLPACEPKSSDPQRAHETSHQPHDRPWMGSKQKEVVHKPFSKNRIPGDHLGHPYKRKEFTTQKDYDVGNSATSRPKFKVSDLVGNPKADGNPAVFQFCGALRHATLPELTIMSSSSSEDGLTCPSDSTCEKRRRLVANKHTHNERNLGGPGVLPHCHGRFRHRMGSVCQRQTRSRLVDVRRTSLPFEYKRIASHLQSADLYRCYSAMSESNRHDAKRQQDGSGIPAQARGNEVKTANEFDSVGLPTDKNAQRVPGNELSPRSAEWHSRRAIPMQSLSGMAPPTPSLSANIQQVGDTSRGSDGVQASPRCTQVRDTGPARSTCDLPRHLQSSLGLQASLGVPTTLSDVQSPSMAKPSSRHLHSDLSQVEKRVLESGHKAKDGERAVHNRKPSICSDRHKDQSSPSTSERPSIGGMAMSGWEDLLKDWSSSEINIIESSWRPSTLKTYKQVWIRWLKWCQDSGIDNKSPGGHGLAKYLIYLYNVQRLSYKTILVHKSVVSSFCQPDLEIKLSSHILVRQALKGIANSCCATKSKIKAPIWNPQVVVEWLLRTKPNTESIFDVSRRCAILLLLASGRRVHDLTLLSVKDDKCIIEERSVTFWPLYGSKTDTINHKQSGWQLLSGDNSNIDPVLWIKTLIEVSRPRRILGNNIENLFVTTRGDPKPASRTVIAGWIKTVLKDAGIQDSPGSIRSAVASLNWVNEIPLEEILARGNWTTPNTLIRYYRRPLRAIQTPNVLSLTNSFTPL